MSDKKPSSDMFKLTFSSSKGLRNLAKKTLESKKFRIPYSSKTTIKKSFDFVKDEGIYIMNSYSNKNGKNDVVYARGFNPKTNDDCWEDSRYAVGGDDFVESITMSRQQLERISRGGKLEIFINEETIGTRA